MQYTTMKRISVMNQTRLKFRFTPFRRMWTVYDRAVSIYRMTLCTVALGCSPGLTLLQTTVSDSTITENKGSTWSDLVSLCTILPLLLLLFQ
ncbi:unnamed protein product [Fasciola hepatica]|uniref:Uncharacterized protein n=1 Tax=Fasciola hepatica TaxID=6192 RepID=A0ABC9HHJ5_FASHE